ncbi:hypothetical protein VUR80DRAFT_7062 [Thermomyces stellatus]
MELPSVIGTRRCVLGTALLHRHGREVGPHLLSAFPIFLATNSLLAGFSQALCRINTPPQRGSSCKGTSGGLCSTGYSGRVASPWRRRQWELVDARLSPPNSVPCSMLGPREPSPAPPARPNFDAGALQSGSIYGVPRGDARSGGCSPCGSPVAGLILPPVAR